MIQRQYETGSRLRGWRHEKNLLLKRHPILLPALLLLGAGLASSASFSAVNVFPLLTLIGIPSNVLCLSIALVLGITGTLASIIGVLEHIDRRSIQAATFPEAKE